MKDENNFTPFYSSFLALCKRDGLSPTEAAKRADISSGAPTAWKKKGAIPRPEQLKKLCALFNVSERELLGYSTPKEQPPAQGEGLGSANANLTVWDKVLDQMSPEELKQAIIRATEKLMNQK